METFKRILVISRLIPYSQKALRVGISMARKYDSKLIVLHLISHPVEMMALNAPGIFPGEQNKNYSNSLQEGKERLAALIKQEGQSGFPIKELVSDLDPVDEITRVVNEEKIDLLLLSAREEGHIEHTFFGGENDAILRRMPCSILLVKNEPGPVEW
ncbi:MAG: universal stress protein [Desulfuromonadales bacterium]